ncbi:MAG: heme exporter protein CcmD [Alphaproteobacteria bacterium]|nr:heme exporter protein CcmD [Alphaproteobacteria bacterium]
MMATPYFGYILSAYGVSAFALLALGWHSWINWRRSQLEATADGMTDQASAEALPTQKEANPHEQG